MTDNVLELMAAVAQIWKLPKVLQKIAVEDVCCAIEERVRVLKEVKA